MSRSDPMRLTTSMAVILAAFLLSQSAQARSHYSHSRLVHHEAGTRAYAYAAPEGHYGYGGRPAAWCGWEMRQLVSHDPGPEYNLARNWARWGHAGPPASARWWFGPITSARSSGKKTECGSSN